MEKAYDLVIRGGSVVDGTGGAPLRRPTWRSRTALIAAVGEVAGARRRGDRRPRPGGDAGLRRHPHPLRRPGDLGRAHAALVLARGDHGGDGQLRRRLRALPARRPRPAGPADGRRRGHPLPGADRGPAVELGELSRLSRRPGRRAASTSTSAASCRTRRCASSSWASAASNREPATRGRHRRDGAPSPSGRWRPARIGFATSRTLEPPHQRRLADADAHRRRGRADRHRHGHGAAAGQRRAAGGLRLRRSGGRVRHAAADRGARPAGRCPSRCCRARAIRSSTRYMLERWRTPPRPPACRCGPRSRRGRWACCSAWS